MPPASAKTFGAADIGVFVVTLVLAALVGVYYAYKDRKKKTLKNYYYGGKKMSPIPLGLSISVTFTSALTVMSFPGDTYIFGTVVAWYGFITLVPTLVACIYYVPFFHKLQFLTLYEFLERRYHRNLRYLTSGMEIFNQTLYMGFTIYLPALALNAVTPLKLSWSIALSGGLCTFYTVVGGMKAVVWTDVLQSMIMLTGVVAALIKGSILVGGFGNIWEAMERGNRTNMLDFNPDPTLRNTFWTIMVGLSLSQYTVTCVNQSVYQRYLSCRCVSDARKAALLAISLKMTISMICFLGGCVAYTYFETCDPIKNGAIAKSDQIMPYFVMNLFYDLPGLAGFYVAAVYSGTLSTVSSGINSLSALLLKDFISPFKPKMTTGTQMTLSKLLVFIVGVAVSAIAFLASVMGGTVVKMVIIFRSACAVPALGVFTMGIFLPWTNYKGAFSGQIVGTVVSFWIALGGYIYGKSPESTRLIPTSVEGCESPDLNLNFTTIQPDYYNSTFADTSGLEKVYPAVYALSYMYISWIGFLTTIGTGLVVSFLTGANNPRDMNPTYFVPILGNRLWPEKVRSFFRFGVPDMKDVGSDLETKSNGENKEDLLLKENGTGKNDM